MDSIPSLPQFSPPAFFHPHTSKLPNASVYFYYCYFFKQRETLTVGVRARLSQMECGSLCTPSFCASVHFLLTSGRMQGRASKAKADSLKPSLSSLLHPQQILQCWLPKELSSNTVQARPVSYLKRMAYLYTFHPPSLSSKLLPSPPNSPFIF